MADNRELINKLYEKYTKQGIDKHKAMYRAYDGARKLEQKQYTIEYFREKIKKGGYERLLTMCQHVLLRPNDNKKAFGEKGFSNLKQVCEELLENHKETELYKYYYELPKLEYKGMLTLERWKGGYFE